MEQLMAWLNEAQVAVEAGQHGAATAAFRQVQALLPADASIAMALANSCRLAGDGVSARKALVRAHADADWSDPAIAYALGTALLECGHAHEAVECFGHTVSRLPRDAAAHSALAGAFRSSGQLSDAWSEVQQAVALAPRLPAVLLTSAQVRHDMGDFAGAANWLNRAEVERPGHGPTRVQRAYTSLIQGVSSDGWALFDARPLPTPEPDLGAKAWNGESLHGESILVTAEQGVGDQFQFLRFVRALSAYGAGRVVVECHPDAVSLLKGNGFDCVPRGEGAPDTAWHVPLLSLPHRLGTGLDVFGDLVPYLRSPSSGSNSKPETMATDGTPNTGAASSPPSSRPRRIGLVWAGNPDFPGRATRDFDVSLLPELIAIPGVQWVSLQHGAPGDIELAGLSRVPLSRDWLATSSILESLDGLVTTDTGIAHLAGAMGIPTWVMLSFVPDWRWGAAGGSTPWYPTMHLVRQRAPGDWAGVVRDLAADFSD